MHIALQVFPVGLIPLLGLEILNAIVLHNINA